MNEAVQGVVGAHIATAHVRSLVLPYIESALLFEEANTF